MWNDRRLARRAARGDNDAFAAIFRRYQQDLYRYCVAILGNEQDAQDALQNTMVKALGSLPGERRQIDLKPWLYRVAHNESIELRRRARPTAPLLDELPTPDASPEQRAGDRRRLRYLLADIAELPERHRAALVMRELAGLDIEEIAVALDTSPGAVRQVVYEARRGLQRMSDGREMTCDSVTAILSDRDGRVARRGDVRAHLRDCPECRRFGEGIRSRTETLAGIAPLPAVAAAAIAKGALAGAAGGGASAGAGAGAGAGAAGLVGGAAAKVASTGAILKSAAGIVAVVAVGAVAVDHGPLFQGGSSPAGGGRSPAAVAHGGSGGPSADARPSGGTGHVAAAAGPVARGAIEPAHRLTAASLKPSPAGAKPASIDPAVSRGAPATTKSARRGTAGGERTGRAHPTRGTQAHPAHSAHPKHPAHPDHPAHPAHPAHPSHPAHPDHPVTPEHPTHLEYTAATAHPEKSRYSGQSNDAPPPAHQQRSSGPAHSRSGPPSHAGGRSTGGRSTAAAHPKHPSHPSHARSSPAPAAAGPTAKAHPEHPEHPSQAAPHSEATAPLESTAPPAEPAAPGPTSPGKEGEE